MNRSCGPDEHVDEEAAEGAAAQCDAGARRRLEVDCTFPRDHLNRCARFRAWQPGPALTQLR